jgi:phosphatidylglycerophosphate synthase
MIGHLLPMGAVMLLGGAYASRKRTRNRFASARTDKLPDSPFVPKPLVEIGYTAARSLGRGAARLGLTANLCTALSIVLGLFAAVVVAGGHLVAGGLLLLFGSSFDTLDGIIARETGTASDAGELLDATADRLNDAAAFLGLAYYYRNDVLGFVLVCVALVGSLLVSYVRAKGEALQVDCAVGWMQRHERIIWLGLGLLVGPAAARWIEPDVATPRYHLLLVILAIIGFFSLLTAIQRTRLVYRALVARRDSTRKARPA